MAKTTVAAETIEVVLHAEGGGGKVATVKSFKEASDVWCQYRDDNDIRASQMFRDCGKIKRAGRTVGYVSYNGRVWDMEQNEIQIDGEV